MRGFALCALVLVGCAHVRGEALPPEAQSHRARTDDGVEIELTRYLPVGASKGLPVLLCHGISANARNMDLDEEVSMARWFAAQGREAWTVSLRGTGTSDTPKVITFDDYWRHDLPAAIAYIRQASGAEAIDYAGHSMGGMVLYAYLSQGGQGVHAAATLGTPSRLDFGSSVEALTNDFGGALISREGAIPTRGLSKLAAPFVEAVDDGPLQRFFYNPQSTRPDAFRRLMLYGTADMAGGVSEQLAVLMKTGAFQSADGAIDFRAAMASITTPVLVVAARLDRIAMAPAVKDGFRALGGPKEWLLITRANGTRGEYGHMDLVIGERAAGEVWSKVLDFFDRHARKEP